MIRAWGGLFSSACPARRSRRAQRRPAPVRGSRIVAQPDSRASTTFHQMVYGKHPFGRDPLGTKASLGALTVADCKNFYKEAFVPNNTICVLVGDFDSKQMIEKITKLTTGWKQTDLAKPKTPEVTKPASFVQKILMMPEAAQLYFFMGHVGIRRNNEDFYKLLVMDYVLGTSTGFNDRLSSRLRDPRAGLYREPNTALGRRAGFLSATSPRSR